MDFILLTLPHIQPRSFTFEAVPPLQNQPAVLDLTSVHQWNRLENLTFINAYLETTLIRSGFFASGEPSSLSLLYDVSELDEIDSLVDDLRGEDGNHPLGDKAVEKRLGMIKEVKIIVRTEPTKSYILALLKGSSILARTRIVVPARV